MKKTDFTSDTVTIEAPVPRWTDMEKMVSDYDTLERNLRDLRAVLSCICLQQDDRTLNVPFDSLSDMPKGIELEVSVDRVRGNFIFKVITPDTEVK